MTAAFRRTTKCRCQGGFTLLEVMIALAVVSVALTALLGLANRTISTNDRLQKLTQATLLAQTRMTELETNSGTSSSLSDNEGDFPEPFSEFHWRTEFLPTPVQGVRQVVVTVVWGDEGENESVDLTSFMFQ